MNHSKKIEWMHKYAADHNVVLTLEGECGFGRECVGILLNESYPDYPEEVWVPDDAYHKHACVAVLGRGEDAENQLYLWLQWFNKHKYIPVETKLENPPDDYISLMFGRDSHKDMVKQ